MLSVDEINSLFSKRPAPREELSEAPRRKKKKQVTGGPNRPCSPVVGLTAPTTSSRPQAAATEEAIPPTPTEIPATEQPTPTPSTASPATTHPTTTQPNDQSLSGRINSQPLQSVRVSPDQSATTDPVLARRLAALMVTPYDENEWRTRPVEEVLSQSFTGLVSVSI